MEALRIAPFNRPGLAEADHYDNPNKRWLNELVPVVARRAGVDAPSALVLDAPAFSSTRKLPRGVCAYVAQHDPTHLREMRKSVPRNVRLLHAGDYSQLDRHVPPRSVGIDHADFCSSWSRARDIMIERLWNNVYADRAIVRLTVCARNGGKTDEQTVDEILEDYARGAIGSEYSVVALPVGLWDKEGAWQDPQALYVAYAPRMINLLFYISRVPLF